MHREARTEPIEKLVVHVNVGSEVEGGAQGLASFLDRQDGGYHEVHDDKITVVTASDDQVVWGASFMNARGKHHCLIGEPDQTAAQWADPYSVAEIERLAQALALDCKKFNIPARHLGQTDVHTPGVKGICGHIDVTNAFKQDGLNSRPPIILDHWDPGPYFPWATTTARVQAILDGNTGTTTPTEEDMKPTDKADAEEVGAGIERYILQRDGGVQAFGGAVFYGSIPSLSPPKVLVMGKDHAVSMLLTPTGKGYWILLNDGGVYTFGDAQYHLNFLLDAGSIGFVRLVAYGTGYRAIRNDGALVTPR